MYLSSNNHVQGSAATAGLLCMLGAVVIFTIMSLDKDVADDCLQTFLGVWRVLLVRQRLRREAPGSCR
jgi:hypothetical protein